MKLQCDESRIAELVTALWADKVPAVLMERSGSGWHIEFLRPHECPAVLALIQSGAVTRG